MTATLRKMAEPVRQFQEDRRPIGDPMVSWLSPTGLLTSGIDVLLSGVFSRYADKRELVAAVDTEHEQGMDRWKGTEGLWIDYVGDIGDGWASTYSVAWAMCQPRTAENQETLPGQVLMLGGDQVYPSADHDRYMRKFVEPYTLASRLLPEGHRTMLAIPGNHDWYDGLTAFMRVFSQEKTVAAWEAGQARSYFALQLPERWWLIGVDIGFGAYLDAAQLSYFRGKKGDAEGAIRPGDRVILCTGKPTWASRTMKGDARIHKHSKSELLEDLEHEIVQDWRCELPLVLSGDLHHYSRYVMNDGVRHRVTAGGGGAYLFPTHRLQSPIDWPDPSDPSPEAKEQGVLAKRYPNECVSRGFRKWIPLSPFANRSFLVLAGLLHLLILTQVIGGIHRYVDLPEKEGSVSLSTVQALVDVSWSKLASTIFTRPLSGLVAVVLFLGLLAFADTRKFWGRVLVALVHWGVHIALVASSMWIGERVMQRAASISIDNAPDSWRKVCALLILGDMIFIVGAIGSGLAFGLYLWLAELSGRHGNDAFAAMRIPDHKSFVRLRIGAGGVLDLFAFGIPSVTKGVPKAKDVDDHDVYPLTDVEVELIERVQVWPKVEGAGGGVP